MKNLLLKTSLKNLLYYLQTNMKIKNFVRRLCKLLYNKKLFFIASKRFTHLPLKTVLLHDNDLFFHKNRKSDVYVPSYEHWNHTTHHWQKWAGSDMCEDDLKEMITDWIVEIMKTNTSRLSILDCLRKMYQKEVDRMKISSESKYQLKILILGLE